MSSTVQFFPPNESIGGRPSSSDTDQRREEKHRPPVTMLSCWKAL